MLEPANGRILIIECCLCKKIAIARDDVRSAEPLLRKWLISPPDRGRLARSVSDTSIAETIATQELAHLHGRRRCANRRGDGLGIGRLTGVAQNERQHRLQAR